MITGSYDFTCQFWDFAGMNEKLLPFRNITPNDNHMVRDVRYSKTGSHFLAVTASARPKLYDRDGHELLHFIKGDMYIKDLTHTKGHIMDCTGGCWHPKQDNIVLTWARDGTVRLWDINGVSFEGTLRKCVQTVKTRITKAGRQQGGRLHITAAAMSRDGKGLVVGCNNSSLQIYDAKGSMKRGRIVENAHEPGCCITSITYDNNSLYYYSRAKDHTLRVWDKRKYKKPVKVIRDLPNHHELTDVIVSPDGKYVVTGTSILEGSAEFGSTVFIDAKTMTEVLRIPTSASSIVRVQWHPKINQVFSGCSNGEVVGFYNPSTSRNGALLCAARKAKKQEEGEKVEYLDIINPGALRAFRKIHPAFRRRRTDYEKYRKERKIPQKPNDTTGRGIDIGTENLAFHILKDMGGAALAQQDPRDALLKWEDKITDANTDYRDYTRAYKSTQPEPVFAAPDAKRQKTLADIKQRPYGCQDIKKPEKKQ